MRRWIPLALLALLAGCGSSESTHPTTSVPYRAISSPRCDPPAGKGAMGVCTPKVSRRLRNVAPPTTAPLIPDTSEWTNSCAVYSPIVFRVYEAGLEREDAKANCFAANARARHVWYAVYGFQRPGHGGCAYQADRTVSIARRLGTPGPVIDDAEVPLSGGEIRCFLARARHDGYPSVEYTCPGCSDAQIGPVWIAAYPYRPAGTWVAHQFSSEFLCRGIYGDCSVDEGLSRIVRVNRAALESRQRVLRYVLVRYGCRRRRANHEHLGPKCTRWFAEGDRIKAQLAAR